MAKAAQSPAARAAARIAGPLATGAPPGSGRNSRRAGSAEAVGSPGSGASRSSSPDTVNTASAASASGAYGPYPSRVSDTAAAPDAIPGSHSSATGPPAPASSTPGRQGLRDRSWHRVPSQLDAGDGRLHGQRPDTPVRLRDRQREHPGVREPPPQVPPRTVVPGRPRPQDRRGVRRRQQRVQGTPELPLLVGEQKTHQRRPFGRPSSRSAMMSRWISFAPA